MQISVLIPVYNADIYVRRAVESALQQPETAEVVLVEDHSPDRSLEICRQLANEYPTVHLYCTQKNQGAGAARNLALQHAQCEFVSFLDVDDYYQPQRFTKAREILEKDKAIDGTYGAMGYEFQDDASRHRWRKVANRTQEIQTVYDYIPPDQLFQKMCKGINGWFHINTLTLRKQAVEKIGAFDEHLRHEDWVFSIKLASICRLAPSETKHPIAIQQIHDRNRVSAKTSRQARRQGLLDSFDTLKTWGKENLSKEQQQLLNSLFVRTVQHMPIYQVPEILPNFLDRRYQIIRLGIERPYLLRTYYFWKGLAPHLRTIIRNKISARKTPHET